MEELELVCDASVELDRLWVLSELDRLEELLGELEVETERVLDQDELDELLDASLTLVAEVWLCSALVEISEEEGLLHEDDMVLELLDDDSEVELELEELSSGSSPKICMPANTRPLAAGGSPW